MLSRTTGASVRIKAERDQFAVAFFLIVLRVPSALFVLIVCSVCVTARWRVGAAVAR
jgi:hypothetical protein